MSRRWVLALLCACSASSTVGDAAIDGSFDARFDLDAPHASDATDAGEVDAFDGEVVAPSCAPLLAVDAVPALDEPREHWLDRLDVIAPRTLDAETLASLESEGVLECRRAVAGDEAPVFYRLRLPRARELGSLRAFAAELSTRHPSLAIAPTARPNVRPRHRADSELVEVAGEDHAIESSMLTPHEVQGALEYAAATYVNLASASVSLAIVDEPVDTTTFARELGDVVARDDEALATLVDGPDAVSRLHRDAAGHHGNEVAATIAGAYDGEVDRRLGPVVTGSGVAHATRVRYASTFSFVSPALVSFALRPDDAGARRVSELEAAHAITLAACARADVVNASWGDVAGLPRALEVLLPSETCRDTLFVVAAPNTPGFVDWGADESTVDVPNLLGVTSTQLGGHVHHPGRATGPELLAAASDAGNSYAAAVVTGVAVLAGSVTRDATAEAMRTVLLTSSRPNEAGDHVLDASAAVLVALASRTTQGPSHRGRMHHTTNEALSTTPGRSPAFTGTRTSESDWQRLAWHAGAVARTTLELQTAALISPDPTLAGRRFWSRLQGGSGYEQRLRLEEDTSSAWEPRRVVPVLELGREGFSGNTLSGQLLLDRSSGAPRSTLTTYCHVPSRTEVSGDGVRVPLAMQSVLPPHVLTVRSAQSSWLVYARTERVDDGLVLPEPRELDECGRGPSDAPVDNLVEYDAWLEALSGDPPIVVRDVVEEIYAQVRLAPLECALEVTRVETRQSADVLRLDIRQQTLDVDFTWGTSACTVDATYEVHRVRRSTIEAGAERFERIEVEVTNFTREAAWDPRDGHLGALDALLHVEGAGDVLPGSVSPRFATTSHSVVGIDWGMPDLRWAPGIGAVGWLDPTQPELAVTVTRGLR